MRARTASSSEPSSETICWLRALFRSRRRISVEPEHETPDLPCPHCGRPMQVTPNPFYGIGMSVHDTVAECGRCDYSVLINLGYETRRMPK